MVMNDNGKSAGLLEAPRRGKRTPADGKDFAAAVSEGWPVAADPRAKSEKAAMTPAPSSTSTGGRRRN
jgi:hypothetical protein